MANNYYTFTAPVVAGTTIRSDKYNTDLQAIESGFEATELELDKRLRLPDTFTGNATIPEVTAADSFLYIDANQDITLYPAATFQAQFDSVESKFDQINTWQGEVSSNKTLAEGYAGDALTHANTASTHAGTATDRKGEAEAARDLAQEWASNASNVYITGTTEYSAKHWAIKAEEFAAQTLATAEGDFVPSARTINSKPLSADVVLQAADVFAVPTTRTINGYDLSADRDLDAAAVGAIASGAFGIGVTDLPDVVGDANTLNESGSVTYLGGGSINLPAGATDGFVYVLGNNANNNQIQLFVQQHQSRMWIRHCNTGVFGSWTEFYSPANKPTAADVGAGGLATPNNWSALQTFDGGTVQVGSGAGTYRQFRYDGAISSDGVTWEELSTQITYHNATTSIFSRQAMNTHITNWDAGAARYTLDGSTFKSGDKVYITRFYPTNGATEVTTTAGDFIYLSDGSAGTLHTFTAAGTICLENIGGNTWIIRKA